MIDRYRVEKVTISTANSMKFFAWAILDGYNLIDIYKKQGKAENECRHLNMREVLNKKERS